MNSSGGESSYPRAFQAAKFVNRMLAELHQGSLWTEMMSPGPVTGDSVAVGVYGYSGESVDWASQSISPGPNGLVPIKAIEDCTEDEFLDDENEVLIPWIVQEMAQGGTPMCSAFTKATSIVQNFVQNYPESMPPIVVNITDGIPTDGDVRSFHCIVSDLMKIETKLGGSLVFNIRLSTENSEDFLYNASSMFGDFLAPYAKVYGTSYQQKQDLFVRIIDNVAASIKLEDSAGHHSKALFFNSDETSMFRHAVEFLPSFFW